MVYRWFDRERWLTERYCGSMDATEVLRVLGPKPSVAHFRRDYVSFRVNGLEYAQLSTSGNCRYGFPRAPLELSDIAPDKLVPGLTEMYRLLSSECNVAVLDKWVAAWEPKAVAGFFQHAVRHYQEEHWLESLLLRDATVLRAGLEARSQVIVSRQAQGKANRFIDVLGLDRERHQIAVIELKTPRADRSSLKQAADYADWVQANRVELLSPETGYFSGVSEPAQYSVIIMIVAPQHSTGLLLGASSNESHPVTLLKVNSDWKQGELAVVPVATAAPLSITTRAATIQPQAIVLTHGDVDGMVCAAQLIRREASRCNVVFANAKSVAAALRRIEAQEPLPMRIYLTDIPADAAAEATLARLAAKGVESWWIDHHPWADGLRQRLEATCRRVVHHESLQTPAGVLLGRLLADEDPYCSQVGRICYAFDKGTAWERDWFRLLSSYVGKSSFDVLERLAYDREMTIEDRERVSVMIQAERESADLLTQEPQTIRTASDKIMAIYDLSSQPRLYLGKKVFQRHRVDFCLTRITQTKWQLACRVRAGLTLAPVMKLSLPCARVGGRRDELLSVELGGAIQEDAHSCVASAIAKML
jgi:hypothetical protein